jgi:hypothetical protein
LSTALSTARASTPNKQQYAPIARKNERHMGGDGDWGLRAGADGSRPLHQQ